MIWQGYGAIQAFFYYTIKIYKNKQQYNTNYENNNDNNHNNNNNSIPNDFSSSSYTLIERIGRFMSHYKIHRDDELLLHHSYFSLLPLVLFNQIIIMILFSLLLYFLPYYYFQSEWGFYESFSPLPSIPSTFFQIIILGLSYEIIFYSTHYYCHYYPILYSFIHKKHHQTRASIGISGLYMTPYDFILTQLFSFLLPHYIFYLHPLPVLIITGIGSYHSIHSHGGYKFVFFPSPEEHANHHSLLFCNYGTGLLDTIFGTDEESYRKKLINAQKEKGEQNKID